jgi:hypothetical protein
MDGITRREFYAAMTAVWVVISVLFLTIVNPSPTIVPAWVSGVGLALVLLGSIACAVLYGIRYFRCSTPTTGR